MSSDTCVKYINRILFFRNTLDKHSDGLLSSMETSLVKSTEKDAFTKDIIYA